MLKATFMTSLLFAAGARAAIVQRPKNLAASVGESSYFNCSTDGTSINWAFSPEGNLASSSAKEITSGNCDVVASFSGNFITEKPTLNVCNLIVINANLQLGGYYACYTSGIGESATAQGILVVADTRSSIASNVTEEIEGGVDTVFFKMTVDYSGPSPITPSTLPALFPSLKWALKSDPINTIPSSETVTNTISSSHIIVNATIPSVPSYVCTLYFNPPTTLPPSCDNSTPSFTFSWETSAINTSYNILSASSITVTSYIESGICEAKILECNPYAYPPPHDIHWLDVIRNEVIYGTSITAEFGGEYVFSVTNVIKGNNYTASAPYKLNNDSAFTMDKCKGVSEVNISVSRNNPSEMYAVKTSNKINLHSSENATEITIENATEVILTCIADGLPNPSYIWSEPCNTKASQQQIIAKASGSYECEASNSINDRIFSKSATINANLPIAAPLKCECAPGGSTSEECDSTDTIILGVFFGLSLLLNIASVGWILLHFMRKKNSPKETSSRPVEYANISSDNPKATNQSPTGPYEELHRDSNPPTAVVYEELSKNSEQRSAQ